MAETTTKGVSVSPTRVARQNKHRGQLLEVPQRKGNRVLVSPYNHIFTLEQLPTPLMFVFRHDLLRIFSDQFRYCQINVFNNLGKSYDVSCMLSGRE